MIQFSAAHSGDHQEQARAFVSAPRFRCLPSLSTSDESDARCVLEQMLDIHLQVSSFFRSELSLQFELGHFKFEICVLGYEPLRRALGSPAVTGK